MAFEPDWLRESLNKSPQMRDARIRMGCKADFAADVIGKKFNAADRPSPGDRARRGACSALP